MERLLTAKEVAEVLNVKVGTEHLRQVAADLGCRSCSAAELKRWTTSCC